MYLKIGRFVHVVRVTYRAKGVKNFSLDEIAQEIDQDIAVPVLVNRVRFSLLERDRNAKLALHLYVPRRTRPPN